MTKNFKKAIAVLCAIAMVVTSITVYNAGTAKASDSATGNGKVYTVTDGTVDGFTGFTCNGVNIISETDGYIGLAWGVEVDAASIKALINGEEAATYNGSANGVYINYSEFKDLADGEYPIVVTATTVKESKTVTGNATLKIEDQSETQPAVTDPEKVDWDSIGWLGNGTTDESNLDKFKAYVPSDNPKKLEVVNIQTKNDVNALYMPNQDSPAEKVEVNGTDITGDCIIDGAQTFVPVTALTARYNTVKITTVNGNALKAFIYNKAGEGEEPVDPTTSGEGGESVDPTTSGSGDETSAPAEMTFEEIKGTAEEIVKGNYVVWINTTNTMQIAVDPADADHIQSKIVSNDNNWEQWGAVQYKIRKTGLKEGEEYTISVDLKADTDDGVIVTDGDVASVDLSQTTAATLTKTVTADENGTIELAVGAGQVGIGVVLDFSNIVIKDKDGNDVEDDTSGSGDETSTPDETTTENPTTPKPTPKPTTAAPTTARPTTAKPTTAAPKTTKKKVLSRTTVKKATKKKAAKKVSVTFKKVTGAKKYQVQISTTKKFKKVLVKKTVKKVKVTITNRKLRNKKKLYVRVKAVGAKKWSKVKKVTVKK